MKNNFHFALRNASYNEDIFISIKNKIDFKDFHILEDIMSEKLKILVTSTSFQDSMVFIMNY